MMKAIKGLLCGSKSEKKDKHEQLISNIDDFCVQTNQLITHKDTSMINQYDINPIMLGAGAFSQVWIGTNKKTDVKQAIKIISKQKINSEENKRMYREIEILKRLDHPNIVKVLEFFENKDYMFIITELCTGGELFDMINKGKISEEQGSQLMYQILRAVNYCHQNGIVHRDLKPEIIFPHILVSTKEDHAIKIIDFGSSIEYTNKQKIKGKTGTPFYVAPEVLKSRYNEKCDIWSCGVILYVLLAGYPPINGPKQEIILERVKAGKYNFDTAEWDNISIEAKNFVRRLMEINVNKRYTAQEALQDIWITKYNSQQFSQQTVHLLQNMANYQQLNQLQRSLFSYIILHFPSAQSKALTNAFSELDPNNDGTLSKTELVQAYQSIGFPLQKSQQIVENLFKNGADQNNNFTLEFSQFVQTAGDRHEILSEENLYKVFQKIDDDNSGEIDVGMVLLIQYKKGELKNVFKGAGQVSDQVWLDLIKQADSDGNGQISYEEFQQMMKKLIN